MEILALILGILIGAMVSLVSTVGYDKYKEHRTRKRLAAAISEEIRSLLLLMKEKGFDKFTESSVEELGEADVSITFNYFIVYESHAELISLFDQELLTSIVPFYNRLKALLEDFRMYCKLSKERESEEGRLEDLLKSIRTQYKVVRENSVTITELTEKECRRKFLYIFP